MARRCLLCYITDRSQFSGDEPARRSSLLAKIAEATRAGVDYVQLREKDLTTRDLESLAREAVCLIQQPRTEDRELRTRLLINSRTDVALAAGADGVHLRSDDISPTEARRIVENASHQSRTTDRFIVGVSCHTAEEVNAAAQEHADFTLFAPVFEKRDRPEAQPAGLAMLRDACRAKVPVLALGGVTIDNAPACLQAGAAGIAAIRLFQENRIEEVVRVLRQI